MNEPGGRKYEIAAQIAVMLGTQAATIGLAKLNHDETAALFRAVKALAGKVSA